MIENPEYILVEGTGELSNIIDKVKVNFKVFLINQKIAFYCTIMPNNQLNFPFSNPWSFKGHTASGESIQCNSLLFIDLIDNNVELLPNTNVIIGSFFDSFADMAIYRIYNLYDLNFDIYFSDYRISVRTDENSIGKNISYFWEIPQSGGEIILQKETANIEETGRLIELILYLLSIASGRDNKIQQRTFSRGNRQFSILQNNIVSSHKIVPILEDENIPKFVRSAVAVIQTWEPDKVRDLMSILELLNKTDEGFLDDRILALIQSYEIIANNWIGKNAELANELKALRANLQLTLKQWHSDFPNYDKNRFWNNRVLKSLEWDKTIDLLNGVLVSQGFDLGLIKVDFNTLLKLRNETAHTGRFRNAKPLQELFDGQFAIRLFLLSYLGYEGKVRDYRRNIHEPVTHRNLPDFKIRQEDSR